MRRADRGVPIRVWAALGVWALSGIPASGQEAVGDSGPLAEEVSEALEDLDEAGVPPSAEESAAFLGDLAVDRQPRLGEVALRFGHRPPVGGTGTASVTLGRGPWHLRVRGRYLSSGTAERTLVAGWDSPLVTVRAGYLGFRHGFGLLAAPPGRSASLGADQSLGPGSARLVGWTGWVDSRTWLGAGVGLARGRWRIHGLAGRDPGGAGDSSPQVRFLRLAFAGRGGHGAAAVMATDQGHGLSWTGSLVGPRHRGAVEGVLWRHPDGTDAGWAGVAHGAWRPGSGHLVEAMWAVADHPGAWPAGRRPAALPDDTGHGWVLRARAAPGPGISIRGLWHQGWALPGADAGERSLKRTTELQWHQALPGTWKLALRFRRTSGMVWEWSPRHPWLPPVPRRSGLGTVVSLGLVRDREAWRVGILVRTLAREFPDNPRISRRRSLLAVNCRARPDHRWSARLFIALAWGQDVDLVSAVVPFGGLVLPRHWGKWRSETGLGLEHKRTTWSLRLAAGIRRPEPGRGEVLDSWLRSAVDWRW